MIGPLAVRPGSGLSWHGGPISLCTGVYEYVHLLADIDGRVEVVESVDDLEHACVHTLGVVTGEPAFAHDKGLDPDESQRIMPVVRASQLEHRSGILAELRDVMLVDVGPNMHGRYAPQHHEPLIGLIADALPHAHVDLQNLTIDRRTHCRAVDFRADLRYL